LLQFCDRGLNQSCNCKRVLDTRLRVAHAHFQRVEKWVQPDVPPEFLRVIDAAGPYEQLAVVFVLGKALERVGNSGARKTLEHFYSIACQARVLGRAKL